MRISQANIYIFIVNNRNARKGYKICSKLTIKNEVNASIPPHACMLKCRGVSINFKKPLITNHTCTYIL